MRMAIILIAMGLVCLVVGVAFGHDSAHWIMVNPRYVDATGAHCCGISDCKIGPASDFREAPDGVHVQTNSGEVLMPRSLVGRGLYPSTDDRWWICVRAGVLKCVFKPTSGT